ncbi:hypothetical protein D915_006786 [Fasciola hepatica]|uniref:Uncharacterized protein n=1 Tax=Fasciola hepatica TaxID=6192 RepID=A0A4E0R6E8_FASHE|nr:hypothetical protein D915_006786 [Fasciola hepatica]
METNSDPYHNLDPPCYQLRIATESMPSTFKENFLGCRSRERGENELQLVIYMAELFTDLRADCHDECRTKALLQMLSSWNEMVNRHFSVPEDELLIEPNNDKYRVQAQKIVGYLSEDGSTLNSSTHHWDLRREQGAKQFVMYLVQSIGSQLPLILVDWNLGTSLRSLSVEMQFMFDVTEMAAIESSDLIRRVTSLSEQYQRSVKLSEFRIEAPTLPDPTKRLFQECDEIKSAELESVQQPNEANSGEELKLVKMEQINVDVNTMESSPNIEENVETNTKDQETESRLRDPQSAVIVSGKLSGNGSILNSWFDKWNTEHGLEDKQFILHLMQTANKEDPLILIETKRTLGVLTLNIKFRLVLDVSETAGVNPDALVELLTILTTKHGESSTLVDFEIKKKPTTEKNKEHEIQDTPTGARSKQDNEFANLANSFQSEEVHKQDP